MSKARLLMAIAFSSGLGGCGTCFTFIGFPGGGPASDELRPSIFGGVSLDGRALSKDRPNYHGTDLSIVQLFILFDVPLSLAMDVATLPITIPLEIFRNPDPKKLGPEEEA